MHNGLFSTWTNISRADNFHKKHLLAKGKAAGKDDPTQPGTGHRLNEPGNNSKTPSVKSGGLVITELNSRHK